MVALKRFLGRKKAKFFSRYCSLEARTFGWPIGAELEAGSTDGKRSQGIELGFAMIVASFG